MKSTNQCFLLYNVFVVQGHFQPCRYLFVCEETFSAQCRAVVGGQALVVVQQTVKAAHKVDYPTEMLSLAPTRVKILSTRPMCALSAGTKHPICAIIAVLHYRSAEIHERHRTLVLLLHAVFDVK